MGSRVAKSYDGEDEAAPLLHVEFLMSDQAAPVVNAGSDQQVSVSGDLFLQGNASDDGLPASPGLLETQWTQVSGPGTAAFSSEFAAATTVGFSLAGQYTLRLSANDG